MSLKLPDDLIKELEVIADREYTTKSAILRRAVVDFMKAQAAARRHHDAPPITA